MSSSYGPRSPTTWSQPNTADGDWANLANIAASDDARATVSVTAGAAHSEYLQATGFGFTVPSTAVILGVLAEIEMSQTVAGGSRDLSVLLLKAGVAAGSDKSTFTALPVTASEAYRSYGSASDLWGTTITPADVNNALFGVEIALQSIGADTVGGVDHVRMTVTFDVSPKIAVPLSPSGGVKLRPAAFAPGRPR